MLNTRRRVNSDRRKDQLICAVFGVSLIISNSTAAWCTIDGPLLAFNISRSTEKDDEIRSKRRQDKRTKKKQEKQRRLTIRAAFDIAFFEHHGYFQVVAAARTCWKSAPLETFHFRSRVLFRTSVPRPSPINATRHLHLACPAPLSPRPPATRRRHSTSKFQYNRPVQHPCPHR